MLYVTMWRNHLLRMYYQPFESCFNLSLDEEVSAEAVKTIGFITKHLCALHIPLFCYMIHSRTAIRKTPFYHTDAKKHRNYI